MWICLNDAFLSIVYKDGEPNEFCVRARRKTHITNVFPEAVVAVSPNNDYRYRAFITKDRVVEAIVKRMAKIDYDNFKSSVEDEDLHDAYMDVWSAMHQLQR